MNSSEQTQNKSTETKSNLSRIEFFAYFKIIITIILVIGFLYLFFYFIRKRNTSNNQFGEQTHILNSHSLAPGKFIQTIFVGGKYLVIGITNENINFLTEVTDPKEIEKLEILYNNKKVEQGNLFSEIIGDFFKRKNTPVAETKDFDFESDSVDFLKQQNERIKKMNE
ncbi:MAG: flagellar biosynthetic protein FliO [Spirochaetes bacterium]|nr:flagellar biosynthetic protein FliO [Spirochaetota bacterium]